MRTDVKSSVVGSCFNGLSRKFFLHLSPLQPFRTREGCEMKTEGPPDLPSPLGPTLLLQDFSPPPSLVLALRPQPSFAPSTPLKQARSRLRRHAHRRRLGHTSSLSSVKHKHSLEERAHKCVAKSTICGCKEAARTGA